MSFFTKALSKVGIGAAKVDAVLNYSTLAPGDTISGIIHIKGGNSEQQINKLDLDIYSNYFTEVEDDEGETTVQEHHCKINSWDIDESFVIKPGEEKQIPFELKLSHQAPLTVGKSTTWLKTNLDIDFALDKSDQDYINVIPNPMQAATLEAIEQLGFSFDDAECEGYDHNHDDLPFIQEFEFKARSGDFCNRLDELELVMFVRPDELILELEVDRKAKGISGFFANAFGRDETQVRIVVTTDNIDNLANLLYRVIDDNC